MKDEIIVPYISLTNLNEDADIDITIYFKEVSFSTLIDIGEKVSFKKVLIVENTSGIKERITADIIDMFDNYGSVYGDNGKIKDYDKPIWKVVTKL